MTFKVKFPIAKTLRLYNVIMHSKFNKIRFEIKEISKKKLNLKNKSDFM